ncbi:MAG: EAL domain-containing protein [Scytolyngbya sp. HA4215-MV1]|nr:EAL domain-containing protein [Scytolyngbya sp. HA4215-MV1]
MDWLPYLKKAWEIQKDRWRKTFWTYRQNRGWLVKVLPGGIAALLIAALLRLGVWQPLEYAAWDNLFRLRGGLPWDDRIVLVAIDEASLKQWGPFPWSRQRYVELLQGLSHTQAAVVVLDVPLFEPDASDYPLAAAIAQQGAVVLVQSWDSAGLPLLPSAPLRTAAAAIGHHLTRQEADGVTRQVNLQIHGVPMLPVAAAQVYTLLQRSIPLPDLNQPFWVNWLGSTQQVPQVSFIDVQAGKVPAARFEHKIVLVGLTATILDSLQTPFDRHPAVGEIYLHATVLNNLLQQNGLCPLPASWLILVFLLGGPGLSLVMTDWRMSKQFMILAALCSGWGMVSFLSFKAGYLIPVAMPILLFVVTGGAIALDERLRMNQRLKQSEERYALAVQGSNEGLWDWDLQTQALYFSPRWKTMLGYSEEEPCHQLEDWFRRVSPQDLETLKQAIADHLVGTTPHLEQEYRLLYQDGTSRWMLCRGIAIRNDRGVAYRMAGSQADITDLKRTNEQLHYHAFYDKLTGLPNRTLFLEELRQAIACNRQSPNRQFAVLFIDLDRFKMANDSLGHEIGDLLLVAIAYRLKSCLSSNILVARLSSDEFTVLLNPVHQIDEALRCAERIHQGLASPFSLNGHEIFTAASIGIALSSVEAEQPEDLLRDADIAMYHAKSQGQARSVVFDPAMRSRTLSRLQLETDLRRAIERQEFRIVYQPIVCLTTTKIIGFEALIRWHHPSRGRVSTAEFIPLAEETGLVALLDRWMLQQACQQLALWKTQFPQCLPLKMSVNLSGIQLTTPDLIQQVDQVLQANGLTGHDLKLEITESAIMLTAQSVATLLAQLRERGIELSIDDFGTGYSSLARLHRLPINTLKIDRSFIPTVTDRHTTQDHENWEIVRTIIVLAHNLGLDVIAEGVETIEQIHQLRSLHCEYAQGFFFSRPIDAAAVAVLLSNSGAMA